MKDEIVERVLEDKPKSSRTDESTGRQLRTALAGRWLALALWIVLAVAEFVEGGFVFGILFIVVGLGHAFIMLRTETAPEGEPLVTDEGLTRLFWSRVAFLTVLVAVTVYAFFVREPGFIILLLATIHVASPQSRNRGCPAKERRAACRSGLNTPRSGASSVSSGGTGPDSRRSRGDTVRRFRGTTLTSVTLIR